MNFELEKYSLKLTALRSKRKTLLEQIEGHEKGIESLLFDVNVCVESKEILSAISSATQKRFLEYIESLVTVALQSVYGKDLKFIVSSKDNLDCSFMVQEGEDNEPFFPKDEMGSGVLDIISLALRVVMWSIQKPATRNFMYLDEPMKAIGKGELLENAIAMIKSISEKLSIQFLINTHEPEIANLSDRFFFIKKEKGFSRVVVDGKEVKKVGGKIKLKRLGRT